MEEKGFCSGKFYLSIRSEKGCVFFKEGGVVFIIREGMLSREKLDFMFSFESYY